MKKTVIIILALFSLILARLDSYSAVLLDRVVAAVNGEVITWSELRRVIELEGQEYLMGITDENREEKIKELEKPFLKELIDVKLQLQEAREMGLNVSASETDDAMREIKKKYNLTEEAFINFLQAEGFTLKEYKTRLAEQILLSKVVNFKVRANILVSDKEIEEYYEANKGKYHQEDRFRIRQIFLAAPEDNSQKASVEAKAEEIIRRIKNGGDFAKLSGEFSEDSSREFGGDLGYLSRGTVLKEIEDVVFTLKTGQVSKPFWSSAGLHIIRLEDRIEGGNIDKVREEIKKIFFEKAFKLKYDEWIKELREKAYIEIKL